ncbi:putative MFS family arabinose efflux permease [Janthinobacterium sp. S3M3]|nr:putative MFS family arabinose efflux permease [Janthinobacterium sp. S3T4]MBB5616170.1 putative MFS family arabinose efflux permease [Janthinobacterium sp. S3M3]
MPTQDHPLPHPLATALALSLAAAIALGLTRFSYGLLLPSMRDDLGWTYLLAGSMNTYNALGYFLGALVTPLLMRRVGVWRLLVAASLLAALFMLASGAGQRYHGAVRAARGRGPGQRLYFYRRWRVGGAARFPA